MGQRTAEVFLTALKLGFTSFGGPVAHLARFREEYVGRRQWLSDADYAELVALCQVLPGATSSQVGLAIGHRRAGRSGALAAWLGFTLPSAVALALLAAWSTAQPGILQPFLRGLGLAAAAVVAQAAVTLSGTLLGRHAGRWVVAAASLAVLLSWSSPIAQPVVLLAAALAGLWLPSRPAELSSSTGSGWAPLVVFVALLVLMPLARAVWDTPLLALADGLFRSGSLVFGGGHVVLPLLQRELVASGALSPGAFAAGYGLAQAVPGPLFTVGTYYGYAVAGWPGALVGLVALFLPSALVLFGALPYWNRLRSIVAVQKALVGVNAAVVGWLAWSLATGLSAAFSSVQDVMTVVVLFVLVVFLKVPSWVVVGLAAFAGWGWSLAGL